MWAVARAGVEWGRSASGAQEPRRRCRKTSVQDHPPPLASSVPRDEGFTLVEILVTIILMGTAVVAILVSLQTTIRATTVDRDHAIAFSWLQAASDDIYRAPRTSCVSGQAAVRDAYRAVAESTDVPPAWDGTNATITVTEVEFLGRNSVDAVFEWDGAFCFEGAGYEESPLYTQRVTIQATSPDGELVKTMQMVKSE